MIRSINKVANKGDGYMEMKDMGGQDNLKKLVLGLKGMMSSMQTLKDEVLKGVKVVANTIEFNKQFDRLKGLLEELTSYEPTNPKEREIQTQTMSMVEGFVKELHPEKVEERLAAVKDEIQQRSKHSQEASQMIGDKGDKQAQQLAETYKKQLAQDKKQLQQLEKIMNVVKTIALDSKNMLYNQGTQLRVGGQAIKRARQNIIDAKGQMIQAQQYTADGNRLTLYCCLLITIIVVIILLIYYASSGR